MTVLTNIQLQRVRQACAGEILVNYTKTQMNAALQAIEDVFESVAVRNAISSAIDTATAPLVLTAAQKKKLVKYWLVEKFGIE